MAERQTVAIVVRRLGQTLHAERLQSLKKRRLADELQRLDRRDVQRIAERLGDGHRAVVRAAVIAIFVQTAVDALAQFGIVDRGVGAPATLQRLCIERSEERRVGKACVSTCSSRWSRYH